MRRMIERPASRKSWDDAQAAEGRVTISKRQKSWPRLIARQQADRAFSAHWTKLIGIRPTRSCPRVQKFDCS